jgi:hypothetical protein
MNHSLNDCIRCAAAGDEMRWLAARSKFGHIASKCHRLLSDAEFLQRATIPEHAATRVCEYGGNAGYHTLRAFIADVSASHYR